MHRYGYPDSHVTATLLCLHCLGLNAIEFLCGILDEDLYQTTVKEYEGPFGK